MVLEILWAVLAGTGIGLSLATPPGPVNAIIASQTVTRSWRAGFLVGMGATTADTIFLAVSIVAHSAVASIQGWVPIIALLGAGVMTYFAWDTVRALRRAADIVESKPEEHAKSYVRAIRRWASRRASGKIEIHRRRPEKNPTRTAGPSWSIKMRPAVSHQRIG